MPRVESERISHIGGVNVETTCYISVDWSTELLRVFPAYQCYIEPKDDGGNLGQAEHLSRIAEKTTKDACTISRMCRISAALRSPEQQLLKCISYFSIGGWALNGRHFSRSDCSSVIILINWRTAKYRSSSRIAALLALLLRFRSMNLQCFQVKAKQLTSLRILSKTTSTCSLPTV